VLFADPHIARLAEEVPIAGRTLCHLGRVLGDRWGVSDDEVARSFPCDAWVTRPTLVAWRGVTVHESAVDLWRWVAQVRLAPYSYDWIDNGGHRSLSQPIFHITKRPLWESALADGSYTYSTRGAQLSDVGFIHCSFWHQVETVANYIYADWDGDLLLLQADPDAIPSEIRVENLDGGTKGFPHIYGPLPVKAVRAVHQLVRQSDTWKLPRTLSP